MSSMLHLAHGSVRMGQFGRKVLTHNPLEIKSLAPGKYIVFGRLGDGVNGIDPVPVITESPVEIYGRWSASTGYSMLIDIDVYAPAGDYMASAGMMAATGMALKRAEVTMMVHTISGDSRYWGSATMNAQAGSAVQRDNYSKNGLFKWEAFEQVVPVVVAADNSNAGQVTKRWTHWMGLTPNVSQARSMVAQIQSSMYVIDLSICSNWQINDYNPTTPIHIENDRRAGGDGLYNQIPNFDGLATITLNSIASTGVPAFSAGEGSSVSGVPGGTTAPSWLADYTATAGKKGRLILDYSGKLITVMGVDLPGTTKTW